jgi:glutaredoxin
MKTVEIYSTASCHFCHLAKDFFKAYNIPFTDYDVGADAAKRAEMVSISGSLGVPLIVIDKKDAILGFNKPLLAEKLGIDLTKPAPNPTV